MLSCAATQHLQVGACSACPHLEKKGVSKAQFTSSNPVNAWRFKVDSFTNCHVVSAYFHKYNPQTTKLFVRFIRFNRVLNWVDKGEWQSRIKEIKHLIELNKRLD